MSSLCTAGFSAYVNINGQYYQGFITAAHCILNENQDPNLPVLVYQPRLDPENITEYLVGIPLRWTTTTSTDAAFIITSIVGVETYPFVRWYAWPYEKPIADVREPEINMDVTTLGATTGSVDAIVIGYDEDNGFYIARFIGNTTQNGDSGAPIVTESTYYDLVDAVGIHHGVAPCLYGLCQLFASAKDAEEALNAIIDTW